MKTEVSYKRLLAATASILKTRQFKKKGEQFFLASPNWRTIRYKPNRKWPLPPGHTKFTVEVYTTSALILEGLADSYYCYEPMVTPPRISHVSTRLGYLIGYQQDKWWTIEANNEEQVVQEVVDAIESKAIHFLDTNHSDESICDYLWEAFVKQPNWPVVLDVSELQGLCLLCRALGRTSEFHRVKSHLVEKHGSRPCGLEGSSVSDFLRKRYG